MLNTVTYYHKTFAFTIITGKYVYMSIHRPLSYV